MIVFQLLATFFAMIMIYIVNIHYKKLHISRMESYFWHSLWILFIVISLFPNLLLGISDALHFDRVFDLLIVISLMIITFFVITNYFFQKENNKKIEELVRKIAIDFSEKNKQ